MMRTTLPVAVRSGPQFVNELGERLSLCNKLVQGVEVLFIAGILLMAGTAEMLEGEIHKLLSMACRHLTTAVVYI